MAKLSYLLEMTIFLCQFHDFNRVALFKALVIRLNNFFELDILVNIPVITHFSFDMNSI